MGLKDISQYVDLGTSFTYTAQLQNTGDTMNTEVLPLQ